MLASIEGIRLTSIRYNGGYHARITRSVRGGPFLACRVSSKDLFDSGLLALRSIVLTNDVDACLQA